MKLTMHSFLCATNAHNAHNCQLTVRLTVMKLHFKSIKYVLHVVFLLATIL